VKKFNMRDMFNPKYQEYIVGSSATGRHGVYLVFGEAAANEEREMTPGGHDEILFLMEGDALLINGGTRIPITKGEAVSFDPDESYTFVAQRDCRYVVAGTHITPHEH
jgi:mannose-6-phosphate isomerase-like protein (cupin superfamily)